MIARKKRIFCSSPPEILFLKSPGVLSIKSVGDLISESNQFPGLSRKFSEDQLDGLDNRY